MRRSWTIRNSPGSEAGARDLVELDTTESCSTMSKVLASTAESATPARSGLPPRGRAPKLFRAPRGRQWAAAARCWRREADGSCAVRHLADRVDERQDSLAKQRDIERSAPERRSISSSSRVKRSASSVASIRRRSRATDVARALSAAAAPVREDSQTMSARRNRQVAVELHGAGTTLPRIPARLSSCHATPFRQALGNVFGNCVDRSSVSCESGLNCYETRQSLCHRPRPREEARIPNSTTAGRIAKAFRDLRLRINEFRIRPTP